MAKLSQILKIWKKNKDIKGLIGALKFRDCIIRKEAVIALKKIGNKRALLPLIQALKYEEWHDSYAVLGSVRENAAEALGILRDRRAVGPLIDALNDKDEDVRWKAAWALGNIGDRRAVEPLINSLYDERWAVRRFTASALGMLRDKKAVESLILALGDNDGHVRKHAANALGNIRDKKAIGPLVSILSDEDGDVRWKAIVALGKMRSAAVEPLIEAFRNKDWRVRGRAAEALGNIGDERAVGPLINALIGRKKDGNKYVRGRAAEALGKIGTEDVIEPLIRTMDDPYIYVRTKAKEALEKMESAMQIINYDNGEISFDYPNSWEIISMPDGKKIVKGNSANGITFSINKITNLGDLTSKEFADIIKDVFIIQNNQIISEIEFKVDGMDIYKISGENLHSPSPTKIMIIAFKIDDLLYYLWFAGGHESFEEVKEDIDLITDSFRVYVQ